MQALLVLVVCVSVALSAGVGSRKDHDLNEDAVKDASTQAIGLLNHQTNSIYHRRIGHLIRAQSQVVAGVLWHLDFVWADTTCTKNKVDFDEVTEARCPFRSSGKAEHCKVTYLVQAWADVKEIKSIQCVNTDNDATVAKDAQLQLKKELLLRSNSHSDYKKLGRVKLSKVKKNKYLYGLQDFEDFIQLYGKNYATHSEKMKRFRIFQVNMWIARQLQKFEQGTGQYGATPYSDYSLSEFRKYFLNPQWIDTGYPTEQAAIPSDNPPASYDWRDHNAVSPVKNQGQCGSCWAFSTTGNIEGQWAIKKGKLVSLSEQELVDCDKVDQGCNGGLPSQAYQAIMKLGGLDSEKKYPYDGKGESCSFKKSDSAAYINGSVKISQDEGDMAKWLAKNGPISIGINAMPMQFYMGGIAHPWKIFCNPKHLDHGVLIVGYGTTDKAEPFWIVKNSWGATWGRQGYYYVYRGDGTCGLNTMATSAVVN